MATLKVGIIGGSGMDNPRLMKDRKEKKVKVLRKKEDKMAWASMLYFSQLLDK